MNKTQLNKTYYQTHQVQIKERRKQRYQAQKQAQQTQAKSKLSTYYKAANIQILLSLKDYLESSLQAQRLWTRFCEVIVPIQSTVSDIIEIMRLREVTEDLIQAYWATAKQKIRLTKSWTKLSFAQQQAKKKQWAKELQAEEKELLTKLAKEEAKQKAKLKQQASQKRAEIDAYWNTQNLGKVQCPQCQKWVKTLDEENNLCSSCLKIYES